jgi:hypothetical protein
MASFNSHAFEEKIESSPFSAAEGDTLLAYTVYHIPGSDTNVLVSTGQLEKTFEVPFSATASELSALQGDLGDSASLVFHKGTITATLVGVLGVVKHSTDDYYRGRLKFVAGV